MWPYIDLLFKQCYDRTEALYWRSKNKDPCSSYQGCSERLFGLSFNVGRPISQGRPTLRFKDVVNDDLCKKQLNMSLASDRSEWKNAIRSVTQ